LILCGATLPFVSLGLCGATLYFISLGLFTNHY
jgi:hypothetical protein